MLMRLKVPVNTFKSAVNQIEAGADEIYMGLESSLFNRMSYSARAQITAHEVHSNFTEEEFAETVNYAHSKNVSVSFTANCQHVTNSPNNFYRKKYIEYVQKGIDLGADAVIVSDIGNIVALRNSGIKSPIIAGSYFNCFNRETVEFLKDLGVFRVCLPDQVTHEEIRSIKQSTDIEIETFIGYGCSNVAGSCNFCHNSGEKIKVGVTCRAKFRTSTGEVSSVLDACTDCAICSIPQLYSIGVDSLKIIGREMDCTELAEITRMYKKAIQMYEAFGKVECKEIVSSISWWENIMCSKRCKYENSDLTRSYI